MKLFNKHESLAFFTNCKHFELLPEEIFDHPTRKVEDLHMTNLSDQMLFRQFKKLSGYSFFLVHKLVTEKEVGAGFDEIRKYEIIWEIVRETKINGLKYVIFSGWGDRIHGGFRQFEGREIGFPKTIITQILFSLMTKFSEDFPLEKMGKLKEINWLETRINPATGGKSLSIIDN